MALIKKITKIKAMDSDQEAMEEEMGTVELFEEDSEQEVVVQKHSNLQTVFAKFMEEKQAIAYKKLVVPQSMRSIYWKFFGFPANENGEILTRVKIVCLLCKTQIAYNRNTSNLRMHLQNKHSQKLHELEINSPPRKQVISPESKEKRTQKRLLKAAMANSAQHIYTTNVDGTVHVGNDIQFVTDSTIDFTEHCIEEDVSIGKPLKFMIKNNTGNVSTTSAQEVGFILPDEHPPQSSTNSKSLTDAILEFLIIDLQSPEIVQEQGFQRLVAYSNSPCYIPCKSSLEREHIPTVYGTFKETILSIIDNIPNEISLAAEEWVSNCGESFFTFLIYYQNTEEAILESKMICTLQVPKDWNETQWGHAIDSIIKTWHLNIEKITGVVVSTGRIEFINALISRGLAVIPCLLHSLQVCANACFTDIEVAKIVRKCRTIIGTIISHPDTLAELSTQEQLYQLEQNSMVLDCPSLWISTYNMLHQIYQRREIINTILTEAVNIDQETIDLTNEEWQIVSELVDALRPFKDTIITLSEEKMPHISLLKPLLWQLVTAHLKVSDEDSENAQSFKESLTKMLLELYEKDQNANLLLQIATVLDPRFKEVQYASDEDKKVYAAPIKEMLVKLIEENTDTTCKLEEQPIKKSRLSGMERLLSGMRANKKLMTAEEKADLELAQYQSESSICISNCPLEWWSKVSIKCPNLGKIASRYNCVPVCCPPLSRISAEAQLAYNAKRAALPPHLVDKLLFLHANYNLV